MKQEAQRLAIALACPTVFHVNYFSNGPQITWACNKGSCGPVESLDPLTDLNAMHEAEKTLTSQQREEYSWMLAPLEAGGSTSACIQAAVCAAADRRAMCFLKTIGKWVES